MIPIDMPDAVKRADGSARFAYVTFVMMNDSYVPGALLLAYGLRRQWTEADLVCLVTPEVTADARDALAVLYDHVVEVETVCVPPQAQPPAAGTGPFGLPGRMPSASEPTGTWAYPTRRSWSSTPMCCR